MSTQQRQLLVGSPLDMATEQQVLQLSEPLGAEPGSPWDGHFFGKRNQGQSLVDKGRYGGICFGEYLPQELPEDRWVWGKKLRFAVFVFLKDMSQLAKKRVFRLSCGSTARQWKDIEAVVKELPELKSEHWTKACLELRSG